MRQAGHGRPRRTHVDLGAIGSATYDLSTAAGSRNPYDRGQRARVTDGDSLHLTNVGGPLAVQAAWLNGTSTGLETSLPASINVKGSKGACSASSSCGTRPGADYRVGLFLRRDAFVHRDNALI